MIKYFLLFILPFSLYASKILSYNIYERTDRADVMITFDTPYTGTIKQSISKSKIIIKLEGSSIESSKIKKVSSNFLHSISITPLKSYTKIVASVSPSVSLYVSKTSDSYGLRLRFKTKTAKNNLSTVKTEAIAPNLSILPTKKDSEISGRYYLVIGILLVGIVILLMLKKNIQTKTKKQNSWLFKSTQEETSSSATTQDNLKANVSIRFQKSINDENSVVMLDFGEQSYLVLMGKSNILLDKFNDNKPTNQEEFNSILQSRHQELESFLNEDSSYEPTPLKSTTKEPLQAYKERAASLIYSDES